MTAQTAGMIELPPLPPEVDDVRITWRGETEFARAEDYYYTQDQMRAYGAACAAAAREDIGRTLILQALVELVACKAAEDEHCALDYFVFHNDATTEQVARWKETNPKHRWPLAWEAARAAIAAATK